MPDILFSVTALLFLCFFYLGTGRNKRVLFVSLFWVCIISILSLIGFFQNTTGFPPRFSVVFFGNIIFLFYLGSNIETVELDDRYVLLIHALRIPVEITLYLLFLRKQVPEIMTFNGLNFDMLIGISAFLFFNLSIFFNYKLSRRTLLIWNIIGLLFLLNIVVIAILSAPLPIQQLSFEQPNVAVLRFPFILLPSFVVPVVLLTHIIKLKQLSAR